MRGAPVCVVNPGTFSVKKKTERLVYPEQPWRKNNIINIHLVNINGMLVQEGCMVNHEMPVPNFGKDAAGNTEPLELSVNIAAVDHIRLITPEKQMIRQIDFTGQNNSITILIPPASFSGYALLEVTLKN